MQLQWLVIELLVLGFLVLELILLHRDKRRAERVEQKRPDEPN